MSDDPMDIQNLAKAASEQLKGILSQDIIVQQQARIEELETKLAECKKYRDAYAKCDRIGTQAVRDLEAKLEKLERWQAAAFIAHGNLDLDIEANPEALAELKGQNDE